MPYNSPGTSNLKGWQIVDGGRSLAETSGKGLGGFWHPGGMPEVCDPCGVDGRFWSAVRWCRFARPPAAMGNCQVSNLFSSFLFFH